MDEDHSHEEPKKTHSAQSTALSAIINYTLAERIRARETRALQEFFDAGQGFFLPIIDQILNNPADAEEVLHSGLMDVWNSIHCFEPAKGAFLGWAIVLYRRKAIDRVRKRQAYSRAHQRLTEATHGVKFVEEPPEYVEDLHAQVRRLLYSTSIPTAQQEVLHLVYFRGMSQRQVAAHTGIALGTIKTRLELGLRKLRNAALADPAVRESRREVFDLEKVMG